MISGRGRGKIRPPRSNIIVKNSSEEFETQWEVLKSALHQIHTKNASSLSFEQIYRASYKIVSKKQGEQLYERVKLFEEEWLRDNIVPKLRALIPKSLASLGLGDIFGVSPSQRQATEEAFLKGLDLLWVDLIDTMNMTTDVLMYMDRIYCADSRKASIFTAAMGLFRDHVLRSSLADPDTKIIICDVLTSVILDQISMERQGDVINKSLIRSCVHMLEGLYETDEQFADQKLYLTVFEDAFLNKSQQFYQNECLRLLRDSDASTWLRRTKMRLDEEESRCQTTISFSTAPKITKVVETEMIASHLSEFLAMEGSGVKAMVENNRLEDLALLYKLVTRVDHSKGPLKAALQSRVIELGSDINNAVLQADCPTSETKDSSEDANKTKAPQKQTVAAKQTSAAIRWVEEVLMLKENFDKIWKQCLNEDLSMQSALTKSFSQFINQFPRCSEYLSLFIDDNLKSGVKGKTEPEIDLDLEKAVTLLRYIQDKDIFEGYYKKHLARRLLHKKTENGDAEKQMISKMKQEIGNAFTAKLEGMFKDITLSDELTSGYRTYMQQLVDFNRNQIDLSINVLSTNFWPVESMGGGSLMHEDTSRKSIIWPNQIIKLQESFKAFYLKERNGRQLTWLGFLGNADIRCTFPAVTGKEGVVTKDRRYDLVVPTYGMIILLLFNDLENGESLSFEEILERAHIPTSDVSRMLYTLSSAPKCRVLTKNPPSKDLPKPGDHFTVNANFTSKSVRIKVPVMVGGGVNRIEADDERKETEKRNNDHRGNILDAIIVRIMKSRKQLPHQTLVSEVIGQLSSRFKPDINLMKRRIESLIEREYLERIENASLPSYSYVA
ncbi:Cullin-3 [Podosphaera aphanis]|nr:Cullin-3 [Podosphaera aphanis]